MPVLRSVRLSHLLLKGGKTVLQKWFGKSIGAYFGTGAELFLDRSNTGAKALFGRTRATTSTHEEASFFSKKTGNVL